jgi:hypothetical protein
MDSNPRSPVGRIYANTEIAADREHRGRRSAGKWRIMPIWHRRVISAADHPLRQIGQIGRVLRAFSRGCARLDGKRSSRGRLIWRSRDLPRQETASAGNALLQCTGRAAVLSAQAEGAPRASAGRARPSARSGSKDWFLAWRPPWHLGPQAQPGAEPLIRKLANPETCVSPFTHRGRFICRDAGPPDRSHLRPGRNHLRRGNRIAGVIERGDLEKCSPSREGPRVRILLPPAASHVRT